MPDDTVFPAEEQRLIDGLDLLRETEGQIEPDPVSGELTVAHADYLAAHAVDVELARSLGVRSLTSREDTRDLPGVWPNWANFPAILFPWAGPSGELEHQVRPDTPTVSVKKGARPRKYIFAKGARPILWAVREVANPTKVVIVEGTKQCLAAASHAPDGVSVYGIAGCRMWQIEGVPIPDLMVVDGLPVVVILDADAATNPDVYAAGTSLADALAMEGATKVTFSRLAGDGTTGLDDILGARAPDRRAGFLARVIDAAKAKPADRAPKARKKAADIPEDGERGVLICNRDRLAVINDLTAALLDRWNGRDLFNHGGVLSRLKGKSMQPLDRGTQRDVIQETVITVDEIDGAQGTKYNFTWPDANTIAATMSRADKFAPLDRVARAPFARPDGTIVTLPGYDEATRTMLLADPELEGLQVPTDPTGDEITAAREFLMTEWLGDFPLDSDADRANLLALIVTPAVRGLVPRVPLAVIDGLQMGVGKNLLADSILTVYTGAAAEPMNWVEEADELRKQLTSAFRAGSEFFVFDEAHTIEGAPLAQALTASTWQDRILGVSTMAQFPNKVTWMSLGNQVQVRGDLTRRVYRIAIRPKYANPQDRKASSFRHPGQSGLDLLAWTRANRRRLLESILTLVRAWFAQDQPPPARGISFGSFEGWERTAGGIVGTAGLPDFLGNLRVWRSESDFDSQYWAGHIGWLRDQFGDRPFRTAEVKAKALTDPAGYLAPPRLDDPTDKAYGKALGEAYARLRDRRYEGLWIQKSATTSGHVSVWRVGSDMPSSGEGGGGSPDPGPNGPVPTDPGVGHGGTMVSAAAPNTSEKSTSVPARVPARAREHARAKGVTPPEVFGGGELGSVPLGSTADPSVVYGDSHGTLDTDRRSDGRGRADAGEGPSAGHVPGDGPVPGVRAEHGGGEPAAGAPGGAGPSTAGARHAAPEDHPGRPAVDRVGADVSGLVTLDLETGSAADLYRTGPGYVRLTGSARDDGPVEVAHELPAVEAKAAITGAATITGHNIIGFDLPALVGENVLSMAEVHEMAAGRRLFDGLLVSRYLDPPMAREHGVDARRRHDLGSLAQRYGLSEKLSDVSGALAKKYGGWGGIPVDPMDPDADRRADAVAFREYLVRDVELSRALYQELARDLIKIGAPAYHYVAREHRVAALATQFSVNGFRVDVPELDRRVADVATRKRDSLAWLHEKHGIPLADAKGKAYASPLGTKGGKAALTAALVGLGVSESALWKTDRTGELQVSGDHMLHLGRDYGQGNPALSELLKAVYRVVSARTVYDTVHSHLIGDRVHPRISMAQTTGRWSVTDPGLTVMGKHGGRHVERAVFLPDPGEALVAFDLSQVDMRAIAGLSGDQAYIEMLSTEDPHSAIALALFGTVDRRQDAKAIGHGWNYGRGIRAISDGAGIDPALVRQFEQSMHQRFPRLIEWREEVRAVAASGTLLDNGFGRRMRPDPERAYTQGPALMGQGAARDLMMEGLLRLPAEVLPMLRAQIHDEIILSVPFGEVEAVSEAVIKALSFEWKGVPILADRSPAGSTWAACYEK